MAIKSSLGKLELQGDFTQIISFLNNNDIQVLPITFEHIQRLLGLAFHHRDPFDRMIIAQALAENLSLATKDDIFQHYGLTILGNDSAETWLTKIELYIRLFSTRLFFTIRVVKV